MAKILKLNAAGTDATIAEATIGDIVTSIFSSDSGVTGMYGVLQKASLAAGGVIAANKNHSGSFFNFGDRRLII